MATDYLQRKQSGLQTCEMLGLHAAGYFKNKEVSVTAGRAAMKPTMLLVLLWHHLFTHRRPGMGIALRAFPSQIQPCAGPVGILRRCCRCFCFTLGWCEDHAAQAQLSPRQPPARAAAEASGPCNMARRHMVAHTLVYSTHSTYRSK